MKLYLSGKMNGVKDFNKPLFARLAKKLRSCGYKVINPPELDVHDPKRTWEDCLKRDLKYVVDCDAIATICGWKTSRGANLEIHVGKALNMPVHTTDYWLKRRKK